jgi:hypothetical protein
MNGFRLGASVLGVAAAVIFAQPVYAQISAEQRRVEEIAKEITVYLKVPGTSGSGVLIKRVQGDNGDYVYTVLTAYHVVKDVRNDEEAYVTVRQGSKNERKYKLNTSANAIRKWKLGDWDLAIAQFSSKEKYEVAAIGDSTKLSPNEEIYVAGFPKLSEAVPEIYLRFRIGSIDTMLSQPNAKGYQLVYDNRTFDGMSGGAVLNRKGELVAIHGQGKGDTINGKERNKGIPTALFRDQLDNGDRQIQTVAVARIVPPQPIQPVIDQPKTPPNESESTAKDRPKLGLIALIDDITSTAFSPDGRTFVIGTRNIMMPFDAMSGSSLGFTFEKHEDLVRSVAFSPDGKVIVSGSGDRTLRLWNLQRQQIGLPFRGHDEGVLSVAFSPDGKAIVSGSGDRTLRLWDLQGNQIGAPFRGHKDWVRSVAFSPDGKAIVSGSFDKTLRLWDLQGNQIGAPFQGHEDWVRSVAFSPDGKAIVSGGSDGRLLMWDMPRRNRRTSENQ